MVYFKNKLYIGLIPIAYILSTTQSYASCSSNSNYRIEASNGSTCQENGSSYSGLNTVSVYGKDTQLIFTANDVDITGGTGRQTTMAIGGAASAAYGSGSTTTAEHNLSVTSTSFSGLARAIYFHDTDKNNLNTLHVIGNLTAKTQANKSSSDGIISLNNSVARLIVGKNVTINASTGNLNSNVVGLGNWAGGIVTIGENLEILGSGKGLANQNNSQTTINEDLIINAGTAIISSSGAVLNVLGSTEITQSTTSDTIENSSNAILNFLGNFTTLGSKATIRNNNATINFFGKSNKISGDLYNSNNGLINLSDNVLGGKLTIDGNYVGTNGLIKIDTQIDARSESDKSLTDFIEITGDLSGTTNIEVNNVGGIGGALNKGIHIIETKTSTVSGISEGTPFILDNDNYLSAGKYVYSLELRKQEEKDDGAGTKTLHDNWYIVTHKEKDEDTYTPDIGSYTANEVIGNTLFNMRLEDREGASQYQSLGNNDKGNAWIRMYGNHQQFKNMGGQLKTKGDSFVTQIGTGLVTLGEEDQYNLGAMAGYGHYSGKTNSQVVDLQSKSKINGYSLGLYGTWYAHPVEKRGAYIDSWVLWNKFKNTIDTADQHQYKYDSSGITASIEAGGDYLMNENGKRNWWIQPQGQLTYQGVKMDEFYDAQGIKISHASPNLQARLGFKTYLEIPSSEGAFTNYRPYIALNYIHNTSEYAVNVADEEISAQGFKNLGEIKLGLEGNLAKNSYVWANASYVAGSHSNQTVQGNIGWKYNF